jgi:HK97 family phage prohead protease
MSQFVGYASVTESPYDMGFYDEVVSRGAFSKTLAENPDVHFNLVHGDGGSGLPLARTGRNMTLSEDSHGLRVEADLDDDDPDVMLLSRKVQNGLIEDMSFAFKIVRQRWENGDTFRRILEASLHHGDVTVTPRGANPAAGVVSLRRAALAPLRAPGRDTARQRRVLAEQLCQTGVLEVRSVNLDGVDYDLAAGPSHAPVSEARGRVAVAPVVLPDSTTRAKLNLAMARSNPGATPRGSSRTSHHDLTVADPVREARRALAAARARHR